MDTARRATPLLSILPLLLSLLVGAGASASVFLVFQSSEHARLVSDLSTMAADRAQALRAALAEDSVELDLSASYISASAELAQEDVGGFVREFGRFVQAIPAHEEDMQVLAFVSRVSSASRPGFESLIRREVDSGFSLRELDAGGMPQPAGPRSEYFPITAMEPVELRAILLGLDIASVPGLRDTINRALITGKLTTSAAMDLPPSSAGPVQVWTFRPVYRSQVSPGSAGSRGEVLGLAASAFRVDQMVELALRNLSPAGLDIELRDDSAPGAPVLYYHHSRAAGPALPSPSGMKWSTVISAGERRWTLTAYPTQAFFSRHSAWQSWTLLGGGLLLTVLAGLYFLGRLRRSEWVEALVDERTGELAKEIAKHEKLEAALAESRAALSGQVVQLNQKNRQIQLLNEAADALQSCLSTEEAHPSVALHAPRLLPGTSGALFIHDAVRNIFTAAAEWGPSPPTVTAFKAEDCWALRRGQSHAVSASSTTLPCRHAASGREGGSLCFPLATIGRTMGLLHVTGCDESAAGFAESVAEHVGLALSNLVLRSDLRQLSIHDPLTTLFNRRYMEETLELEIRRAERKQQPIGVIMLDIDHFKAFNDGFGHAAGDEMLRAIGALLLGHLRAGDIACRYGGEEMLLILPEASREASARRAEDLREHAKALEVRYLGTALGPVTVSLGVAVYPGDGDTREELLSAADSALYAAKEAGRDRVVCAGDMPPA